MSPIRLTASHNLGALGVSGILALAFALALAGGCTGEISGSDAGAGAPDGGGGDDDDDDDDVVDPDSGVVDPDGGVVLDPDADVPVDQVPAIVGVGYGGMRVVSYDDGASWTSAGFFSEDGGDDLDLLRAVAWGNGRWVATGWVVATSDDGLDWTNHGRFSDLEGAGGNCTVVEGLAFYDGYFWAICPGSEMFRSTDGLVWEVVGELGFDTSGHTYLVHRGGKFVAHGDTNFSIESTDGVSWSEMGLDSAYFCEGEYREDCDGFWVKDAIYLTWEWDNGLYRDAGDGSDQVLQAQNGNNMYIDTQAFAFGYAIQN